MNRMFHWFWIFALLVFVAPVAAQQPQTDVATQALDWTRAQQNDDGSFTGFGIGSTADALIAFGSADLASSDQTVADAQAFATANIEEISANPGAAAKYVLGLLWTDLNPRNVGGTNLVEAVAASYDDTTGVYGPDVTSHALALLALNAASEPIEEQAIPALEAFQLDDGSWSFTGDRTPDSGDTNTTALAIQALIAADGTQNEAVIKGLEYLKTQQNPDGGFPYSQASEYGNASDANSTALVLQAIIAAEQDYQTAWGNTEGNPLDALLSLQNDSGAFAYTAEMPDDNAVATYQAIPAVLLEPLPLSRFDAPVDQPAIPEEITATPEPGTDTQPGNNAELPQTGTPANMPFLPILVLVGLGVVMLGLRLRRLA